MITLDEFERAQAILRRDTRSHPKRHLFPYAGLLRCGTCQGSVTAEEHYNRYGYHYVYYHCTHKNRKSATCREKCAEEEDLNRQVLEFIDRIYLDRDELEESLAMVSQEAEKHADAEIKRSAEKALATCIKSLDNLTRLRCQEFIAEEEFSRQRSAFMKEQAKLRERLNQLEASDWIEPSRKLFLFSNRAKFWFSHGTTDEKRIILATIGSNLLLKDKKLSIDAKKPFRILSERASGSPLCTVVPGVRTFFETEPGITIPELRPVGESAA